MSLPVAGIEVLPYQGKVQHQNRDSEQQHKNGGIALPLETKQCSNARNDNCQYQEETTTVD